MELETAVRDLAPRLLRYCTVRTGDISLAEELAQESLTALVERWRRRGPPDSPEAFVFAIARRRVGRAAIRRRLWVPFQELVGSRDGHPSPEQQAVTRDERDRLVAAIAKLSRRDREALLLVAVAGLPTSDAATALGISVSAVKMRTLRARQRLLAALETNGDSNR